MTAGPLVRAERGHLSSYKTVPGVSTLRFCLSLIDRVSGCFAFYI